MLSGTLALLASAVLAGATNIITFQSLDGRDRTVVFTAQVGLPDIPSVDVPAGHTLDVEIPQGWIGNYYAVEAGADRKPGMLGEVNFNSWGEMTFFDVSAIVNADDHAGVYMMWPAGEGAPVSGCTSFLCKTLYLQPDDVQTQSTRSTHLITTLGAGDELVYNRAQSVVASRAQRLYPRAAVTDPNWRPSRLHARHFRL